MSPEAAERLGRQHERSASNDRRSSIDSRRILFEDNERCLIDDPFTGLNPDEAEHRARQFVKDFNLENELHTFIKAAKILRDPEAWAYVRGLNSEEEKALSRESQTGFWQQAKDLKVTIITLCVAAVVQGWNQTATNGANLLWPVDLGLKFVMNACDPTGPSVWIFGAVNAAPYFSASLVGCWLSDPLNELFFGRRFAVLISAVLTLAAMISSACCQTWRQLLGCRVLLGLGMGCKASVVPVFAAEVAPAHIRGALVMNWQVFDALGIFLGLTANLAVSGVGPTAWRWQIASSVIPTMVLLSLIWTTCESPRFLIKRGGHKYRASYKTLRRLRGHPILAAKELLYIHFQTDYERRYISGPKPDEENHGRSNSHAPDASANSHHGLGSIRSRYRAPNSINYWQKLGQLFTIKRIRRATVAAVVCMISQQLCGVNVLILYSSTLYCDASDSSLRDVRKSLFLSWGIGLCNFLFALPAYRLIDKRGRRWLLLVALPFMALSMLAAGLCHLISNSNHLHIALVTLFTYIFMIFYSFSMGPVPFTLSAEVFPLENRMVGMSFAVFTNLLGLGLLTLFVPVIQAQWHATGLLSIFAGCNVLAFILVFCFVRETSGAAMGKVPGSMSFMSLETLNYVFGVSSWQYMNYQVKTILPWAWNYYIKRDKDCPDQPEQLFTWAIAKQYQEMNEEMTERPSSE